MAELKRNELIPILMPKAMVEDLAKMSQIYDTDRSKLIRALIRKEWRMIQRRQEKQQTAKQPAKS